MKSKKILSLISLISLISFSWAIFFATIASPEVVFAKDDPGDTTGDTGAGKGIFNPALTGDLGSGDPAGIFGRFLGSWWGTAYLAGGIMFLVYLMWGGVEWIVSGSNEERVTNAKNKITNALIGLTILAASWALVKLIGALLGLGFLENLSQSLDVLAP